MEQIIGQCLFNDSYGMNKLSSADKLAILKRVHYYYLKLVEQNISCVHGSNAVKQQTRHFGYMIKKATQYRIAFEKNIWNPLFCLLLTRNKQINLAEYNALERVYTNELKILQQGIVRLVEEKDIAFNNRALSMLEQYDELYDDRNNDQEGERYNDQDDDQGYFTDLEPIDANPAYLYAEEYPVSPDVNYYWGDYDVFPMDEYPQDSEWY